MVLNNWNIYFLFQDTPKINRVDDEYEDLENEIFRKTNQMRNFDEQS